MSLSQNRAMSIGCLLMIVIMIIINILMMLLIIEIMMISETIIIKQVQLACDLPCARSAWNSQLGWFLKKHPIINFIQNQLKNKFKINAQVRALPSQWPPRLLSPLHICSRCNWCICISVYLYICVFVLCVSTYLYL